MKYFLRILLVLVLSVAVVFGVYFANTRGETTGQNADVTLTTVTKPPVTEIKDDKILLAEYEEGFKLYKQNDLIIFNDGKRDFEFDGWSKLITEERPVLYYHDFDKDKEKELIFEVASRQLEDGNFEHDLYYLDKNSGKYGDKDDYKYSVSLISRNKWIFVLKELLIEEMTQLKCDKIVQFAMISGLETIRYNKDTGVNLNGYGGYFRALQNKKTGEYYKVNDWSIDRGEIYINDKNKICCKVYINVTYHGTDQIQKPGYIYLELFPKGDGFQITPRSMIFRSFDDSKVSPQHNVAYNDWSVIRENLTMDSYTTGDKVIDWVSFDMNVNGTASYSKIDFGTNDTEIRNCVAIDINQNRIRLVAKNGYEFDEDMVKRRDFSVVVNEKTPGDFGENEISYDGKIFVDQNNRQVLEITFDKSYPIGEINTLKFNLPAQ